MSAVQVTVEVGPLAAGDGFYVADDGPGIPPDERGELSETGSTGGADPRFGLTIVRNVARTTAGRSAQSRARPAVPAS
ncbi:hypothetical protein BRC89_01390 [Halobacteriales archaeon QS_4_70_19]|nr:MAG: hypothetical protein BRC89_01390 [Halobacteriales archaeon QS_4_70_19]